MVPGIDSCHGKAGFGGGTRVLYPKNFIRRAGRPRRIKRYMDEPSVFTKKDEWARVFGDLWSGSRGRKFQVEPKSRTPDERTLEERCEDRLAASARLAFSQ